MNSVVEIFWIGATPRIVGKPIKSIEIHPEICIIFHNVLVFTNCLVGDVPPEFPQVFRCGVKILVIGFSFKIARHRNVQRVSHTANNKKIASIFTKFLMELIQGGVFVKYFFPRIVLAQLVTNRCRSSMGNLYEDVFVFVTDDQCLPYP